MLDIDIGLNPSLNLGFLFGKKHPPLLGLDISNSSVRLVELSQPNKHTLQLERYASEPLPPGVVVDGHIEKIEQLSDVVHHVLQKSGSQVKRVALALPSAFVITKKIVLPAELLKLSEEEFAHQVELECEAGHFIPFALHEANFDFSVIGPVSNLSNVSDTSTEIEEIEVLLVAARKDKVEDRAAVAEAVGLKPVVMDIESYAAHAALERIKNQLLLADGIQIESTVVNPFQGMKLAKRLRLQEKQVEIDAPDYLVACGLALRRFG